MKYLFSFLAILTFSTIFAQENNNDDSNQIYESYVFQQEKNNMANVYVDNLKVRDIPNIYGQVIDSLSQNKIVKIVEVSEEIMRLGERSAKWVKISYDKKQGYIWSGNLAIKKFSKNNIELLLGLPKTEILTNEEGIKYNNVIAGIKYFKNGKLVDEKMFPVGTIENLAYHDFIISESKNLKNVDYTAIALFTGEACGIPSYEQNIFIQNNQLFLLPKTVSIGDADIYNDSEIIELPSKDNRLNNQFIFTKELVEKDENEKTIGEKTTIIYNWDGEAYKAIKTTKKAIRK